MQRRAADSQGLHNFHRLRQSRQDQVGTDDASIDFVVRGKPMPGRVMDEHNTQSLFTPNPNRTVHERDIGVIAR